MDDASTLADISNAMTVQSSLAASLAFIMYEFTITFGDEVQHIWQKPNSSWIKWVFLFLRYFALVTQLANFCLYVAFTDTRLGEHHPIRRWYTFQSVVGWLLMTAVEAILMSRVYALYIRSRAVVTTFSLLLVAETAAMIVGTVKMVTTKPKNDNFLFLLASAPEAFQYLGFVAIFSQVVVLALTLTRYRGALAAERALPANATPVNSFARTPIMILTIRDGSYAFLVLFFMSTLTIVYTRVVSLTVYSAVIYAWLNVCISSAGCRLIINMNCLPMRGEQPDATTESIRGHELTTLGPDFLTSNPTDTVPYTRTTLSQIQH